MSSTSRTSNMTVSRMQATCHSVTTEEQATTASTAGQSTASTTAQSDKAIEPNDSDASCSSISSQTIVPDDSDASCSSVSSQTIVPDDSDASCSSVSSQTIVPDDSDASCSSVSSQTIVPDDSDASCSSVSSQTIVPDDSDASSACGSSFSSQQTVVAFEDRLSNPSTRSSRRRELSPVPPLFFRHKASQLIVKLWSLRCPDAMGNTDIPKALEGIIRYLPEEQCMLLCIGCWYFGIDEEMICIWEFYEFTFHGVWDHGRGEIFKFIAQRCSSVYQSLPTEEVIRHWDVMIATIGKRVRESLTQLQYPLCTCDIEQPHSFHLLQQGIQVLEGQSLISALEIAQYAVTFYRSLRVLDLTNKERYALSQHPSFDCHQILRAFLRRLHTIGKSVELSCAVEYETAHERKCNEGDSLVE